jgi:hypothetical protein
MEKLDSEWETQTYWEQLGGVHIFRKFIFASLLLAFLFGENVF